MSGSSGDDSLARLLAGLAPKEDHQNTNSNPWSRIASDAANQYGSLVGLFAGPAQPAKTTSSQVTLAEERFKKRLQQLNSILPVTSGRTVPDDDDLIIGGARRLKLAVLFLDICGFSRIANGDDNEQDRVLKLLNLFMAEMLHVVKSHEGIFEKNTGDGLMAYFGEAPQAECTQRAVDAAVTMHCYNDQVISPRLKNLGLPEVKFRVGIETGSVTLANVGVRGDHHSLVAVGNTPNIACKLMKLIPAGGIVLGDFARSLLSEGWKRETAFIGPLPDYFFTGTQTPYSAWELKYRAPSNNPAMDWAALVSAIPGGR
jgi:class 3 adenylate cyclase